ncbi:MAG TPA: beta-ketoacyl-ACP synthase III [Flavobacteriaceae bacterium]|nr:beta-ketoacyl-ACP synthase III [Flavobacteriaceae bacterium]
MKNVYITKTGKFLPNNSVGNDEMEEKLGLINEHPSRARRIVLRNNGIKNRYYAVDENGNTTHTNAELTAGAIKNLCDEEFSAEAIELFSCGTSTPDHLLPSHASMVHGLVGKRLAELNSSSGVCCSGMNALKYAYLSVVSGNTTNAICTGSERVSTWMQAQKFNSEVKNLKSLEKQPIIAFKKEFLRWMLSDGAGAFLLQTEPNGKNPLRIDWAESHSYAFELETCMYAGGDKLEDGSVKPWSDFQPEEWLSESVFSLKQDVKLLDENIITKGVQSQKEALQKHQVNVDEIDFFLPHLSSFFFADKLENEMKANNIHIPREKWFTNLENVGNVGSASIYLMLEELKNSDKLKKGNKILVIVPESGRFSYFHMLLTVC